jgi:hypothetical protein
MIRKQTWILLGIFVVLAGAAFYLQKNPIKHDANITPSPTSQAFLLNGWQSADINHIDYKDALGVAIQLEKNSDGWLLQPDGNSVSTGKVEELLTQITTAQIMASLNPGYDLGAVGLTASSGILTLANIQGVQIEIRIGTKTPTQTGYYVQVDRGAASVVSAGAISSIINLLTKEQLLGLTPTP